MLTNFITYIKETRQEMRKVNWPTRHQTFISTILVIVISIAVAIYLGVFDYIYQFVLSRLIGA
ncbi:MAG: preprotein translocase subunit SecE [bacterium]|nr:preprotein translocase subunit SecE [bacterium]